MCSFSLALSFVQRCITPTSKITGTYRWWYSVLTWNLSKNQNADFFFSFVADTLSFTLLQYYIPSLCLTLSAPSLLFHFCIWTQFMICYLIPLWFSFPVLLVDSNNRLAVRVNVHSSPKYRSGLWMKTGMSWSDFRFVLEHRHYRWKPSDQTPLSQYRIACLSFLFVLKTSARRKRNRSNIPLQCAMSITDFTSHLWELEWKTNRQSCFFHAGFSKEKQCKRLARLTPCSVCSCFSCW